MKRPQTSWSALIRESLTRLGERDTENRTTDEDTDVTTFQVEDVERLHYECACRLLLDVSRAELEQLGSAALVRQDFNNGGALPDNLLSIENVGLLTEGGSTDFWPAREVTVEQWYQLKEATTADSLRYVVMNQKLWFDTPGAEALMIVQPAIAVFQSDVVVLPDRYDAERLDWVHQQLVASRGLPAGRA